MSGAESTSGVYETDHTAPQTLTAPRRAPTRTIPMVRRVPTHTVTSEVHTQQRGRETMAAVQVARERGVGETRNNCCTYLPFSSQGLTLAHACPTRRHGDEADAKGGGLLTHGGGGRQFCCGRVQHRGTMQYWSKRNDAASKTKAMGAWRRQEAEWGEKGRGRKGEGRNGTGRRETSRRGLQGRARRNGAPLTNPRGGGGTRTTEEKRTQMEAKKVRIPR